MKLSKKLALLLLIILLLFSVTSLEAEEGDRVKVTGQAQIEGGDLAQAREMAKSDAFRNAVEEAMGVLVDAQTRTRNYELLEDSIYTQARGYVAEYEVLDISTAQGQIQIELEALVKEEDLAEDIDALELTIHRAGDPRIMVVVPDDSPWYKESGPAAETEIISKLVDNGFRLVDQEQIKEVRDSEVVRRALDGDEEAYQQLAAEHNKDLLVLGEGFSELVEERSGFYSYRARLEARVVKLDTAEIITAQGVQKTEVDISRDNAVQKSLAAAGAEMAEYLLEVIPEAITDTERSLQVTVSGIAFEELQELEEFLKNIHLVDGVYQRDFVDGTARLDIDGSLLPMQMAREITEGSELPLEVSGVSGNKIELKIE
ncbi:hypothetical protein [Fuchsiella alkaliacetigena]|uniref:hypothetical protein n=1 Tax=Fuchsiella alkaliacetigena TaxID=957042 RepID=UPI00200AD13C|nr:hypothetical protein [Fuchsiella alkaliacetigena]MCK8825838.1 hypothetical protein [Fuchsiella alkaliacetigena]